jgi:hypothetical protein
LGEKVLINPLGAWRTGEELELYAEVYGAAVGAPLAIELVATRRKSGDAYVKIGTKGRSLTVKSDELARGPLSPIRKTLSLASLAPGNYVIALRVTEAVFAPGEQAGPQSVRPGGGADFHRLRAGADGGHRSLGLFQQGFAQSLHPGGEGAALELAVLAGLDFVILMPSDLKQIDAVFSGVGIIDSGTVERAKKLT